MFDSLLRVRPGAFGPLLRVRPDAFGSLLRVRAGAFGSLRRVRLGALGPLLRVRPGAFGSLLRVRPDAFGSLLRVRPNDYLLRAPRAPYLRKNSSLKSFNSCSSTATNRPNSRSPTCDSSADIPTSIKRSPRCVRKILS